MVKVRKYKRKDGTKVKSHSRSSAERDDLAFKAGDVVKKKAVITKDSLKSMAKKEESDYYRLFMYVKKDDKYVSLTTKPIKDYDEAENRVKRYLNNYEKVVINYFSSLGAKPRLVKEFINKEPVVPKSAYMMVKGVSEGYVKSFKDDVLVHDRKSLRNYKGDFLYGMREAGTNLMLKDDLKSMNMESFDFNETFLLGNNKRFFVKEGSSFREVSKDVFVDKLAEYRKLVAWIDDVKNNSIKNRFNGYFLSINYSYGDKVWTYVAQDNKYNTVERKTFKNYEDANKYMYDNFQKYS